MVNAERRPLSVVRCPLFLVHRPSPVVCRSRQLTTDQGQRTSFAFTSAIGTRDPPSRRHNEGGAAVVSFDKPAFASYGFDQSYNAPASIEAATAYCVALNYLLENRNHSLRVGPMTVCFWARDSEEDSGRTGAIDRRRAGNRSEVGRNRLDDLQ